MNSVIFCEGRVDAVLIGQYLVAHRGWVYSQKPKENLKLEREDDKQIIYIYKRNDDWVYVWAVGGRNRFKSPLETIKVNNHRQESANKVNNIVILIDNDDGDEAQIRTEFNSYFDTTGLQNNEWVDFSYQDSFSFDNIAKVLLLIIPFDEPGAMETVMIHSLQEDDDEDLIPQCCGFVDNIRTRKYLQNRRLKLKAKLSTIVSIIEPDRGSDNLVNLVSSIRWHKYDSVHQAFKKLLEL
ncbi:MAG TPA: hypothetical protein VHY08_09020 [Bacillota bacterium]|nr:hypothetical protein [Bacillota bacterium]